MPEVPQSLCPLGQGLVVDLLQTFRLRGCGGGGRLQAWSFPLGTRHCTTILKCVWMSLVPCPTTGPVCFSLIDFPWDSSCHLSNCLLHISTDLPHGYLTFSRSRAIFITLPCGLLSHTLLFSARSHHALHCSR